MVLRNQQRGLCTGFRAVVFVTDDAVGESAAGNLASPVKLVHQCSEFPPHGSVVRIRRAVLTRLSVSGLVSAFQFVLQTIAFHGQRFRACLAALHASRLEPSAFRVKGGFQSHVRSPRQPHRSGTHAPFRPSCYEKKPFVAPSHGWLARFPVSVGER